MAIWWVVVLVVLAAALAGPVVWATALAVCRAGTRPRREAADDRHHQEGTHDGDPAHEYRGPARAETFLAACTPPHLSAHA